MQTKQSRQLTIRKVPVGVERALRRRARSEKKSLNQVAVEALARGAGVDPASPNGEPARFHDLDSVFGTWIEDPAFDAAVAAQRRIDPELWK
jgi:hypothetical protein